MKEIIIYKTKMNKCPYLDWHDSLNISVKARIDKRIERVSQGNFGDFKKINNNISELRFKFGSGYRIYFSELEDTIILFLNGGDKSNQSKDIKTAENYFEDFKERFL